jgi:hypothetical protein
MHKSCARLENMYYNLMGSLKKLRLKNENGECGNGHSGLAQWRQG